MGGETVTGRLTAMAMHDMLNVLAVLKENAGLLEDLIGLEPAIPAAQKARFGGLFRIMQEQFGVGSDLAEALKRFGSEAAQPHADVAPLLRTLLAVLRRKARGRKVSFVVDEGGGRGLRAALPPAPLAAALFAALERAVDGLAAGSVVRLLLAARDGRGMVRFIAEPGGASGWTDGLQTGPAEDIACEIKDGGAECRVCFPCL